MIVKVHVSCIVAHFKPTYQINACMYVNSGNNDRFNIDLAFLVLTVSGFYKHSEVNHWGGTRWARPRLFWAKKEEIAE